MEEDQPLPVAIDSHRIIEDNVFFEEEGRETEREPSFGEPRPELAAIQEEVVAWARGNFGDMAITGARLGLVEELGELAKACLKRRQGIRGTFEEHVTSSLDAIGDATIFLMNHLHGDGVSMASVLIMVPRDSLPASQPATLLMNEDTLAKEEELIMLAVNIASSPARLSAEEINWLVSIMATLSLIYGRDYTQVVTDTWNIVKKRDWVADPVSGGNHSHQS